MYVHIWCTQKRQIHKLKWAFFFVVFGPDICPFCVDANNQISRCNFIHTWRICICICWKIFGIVFKFLTIFLFARKKELYFYFSFWKTSSMELGLCNTALPWRWWFHLTAYQVRFIILLVRTAFCPLGRGMPSDFTSEYKFWKPRKKV